MLGDPPGIDGNARFTQGTLKLLYDQKCGRFYWFSWLKVINYDNSFFFLAVETLESVFKTTKH